MVNKVCYSVFLIICSFWSFLVRSQNSKPQMEPCFNSIDEYIYPNEFKWKSACVYTFKGSLYSVDVDFKNFSNRNGFIEEDKCCVRRVSALWKVEVALPCDSDPPTPGLKPYMVSWFRYSTYSTPLLVVDGSRDEDIENGPVFSVRGDLKGNISTNHQYGNEKLVFKQALVNGTYFCAKHYKSHVVVMPVILLIVAGFQIPNDADLYDKPFTICEKILEADQKRCLRKYTYAGRIGYDKMGPRYDQMDAKELNSEDYSKWRRCWDLVKYVFCMWKEAVWRCPEWTLEAYIWALFRMFERLCVMDSFVTISSDSCNKIAKDFAEERCFQINDDSMPPLRTWTFHPDFSRIFQFDITLFEVMQEYCILSFNHYVCIIREGLMHAKRKRDGTCQGIVNMYDVLRFYRARLLSRCFYTPFEYYYEYRPKQDMHEDMLKLARSHCKPLFRRDPTEKRTNQVVCQKYYKIDGDTENHLKDVAKTDEGKRILSNLNNGYCCSLTKSLNCELFYANDTCPEDARLVTYHQWYQIDPILPLCKIPFEYDCWR